MPIALSWGVCVMLSSSCDAVSLRPLYFFPHDRASVFDSVFIKSSFASCFDVSSGNISTGRNVCLSYALGEMLSFILRLQQMP